MLCLVQEDEDADSSKTDNGQEVSEDTKPEQQNPIVGKIISTEKKYLNIYWNLNWEIVLKCFSLVCSKTSSNTEEIAP